ncbi:MAG: hypothetical protein L6R36_009031 [Xanthoria steineri]|nr:MAG: hypothetical protein L6R36_009031 [Xanthoria steineri]
MPDPPVLPESALEATNKTPSLGSVDATDKVRRNSMKSNSTRSAFGDNKTSQPNATVDAQCEQRRDLSQFVIKTYILDDHSSPGAISLKFRLDRIPVRQVEIQKDLFSSEEYGHQSVLDAYLDLYDHERVLISNLIDCIDSQLTLKLLKRNYTDISYRGILIKGVPELRFIMERSRNDKQDNSDDGAISEAAREIAREAARRAECEAKVASACQAAKATVSIGYGPMELASTGIRRPSRDRSRYTSLADRSIDRHRPMSVRGDTISTPSSMYHPERFTPFRFKKPSEDLLEALEATEVLRENEQSDGSDESSIMSDDDAMNDEEAEKAVKELLEKYTTLGTVGRESG